MGVDGSKEMGCALLGFAVCLEAVAQFAQQLAHECATHLVAHSSEASSQDTDALRSPPQRRLRITRCDRLHQALQVDQQPGLKVRLPLAARSRPPDSALSGRAAFLQLTNSARNRRVRNPGCSFDQRDTAVPSCLCFCRRPDATATLSECGRESLKLALDRLDVDTKIDRHREEDRSLIS